MLIDDHNLCGRSRSLKWIFSFIGLTVWSYGGWLSIVDCNDGKGSPSIKVPTILRVTLDFVDVHVFMGCSHLFLGRLGLCLLPYIVETLNNFRADIESRAVGIGLWKKVCAQEGSSFKIEKQWEGCFYPILFLFFFLFLFSPVFIFRKLHLPPLTEGVCLCVCGGGGGAEGCHTTWKFVLEFILYV